MKESCKKTLIQMGQQKTKDRQKDEKKAEYKQLKRKSKLIYSTGRAYSISYRRDPDYTSVSYRGGGGGEGGP